jgi:hypothetical protein
MGCRALTTGGKLGIRSSWAGAGRDRKSRDWSPPSAYTDHAVLECQSTLGGLPLSVQCSAVQSCSVQFSSHIQTLSNNEQNQVNGTFV